MYPTEKKLKDFITRYVDEFRRFLEKEYPQRKNDFPLYSGYPYQIQVYVDKYRTCIDFHLDKDKFIINVKDVKEIPTTKPEKNIVRHIFYNEFLPISMNNPEGIARREILDQFAFEEYEAKEAERLLREYEQYQEDEVENIINGF